MFASGSISEIALVFVTDDDFDTQLRRAFAVIGKGLGISRCHLFVDSADGLTFGCANEWCADGIEPVIQRLAGFPYAAIPSWKALLDTGLVQAISDVTLLERDIRDTLVSFGIKAIISAPLRIAGRGCGFLAFDECAGQREWNETEIETLKTAAGIIATAYSRKHLAEMLATSEENFRNLFNTVDDIIAISDLDGRILYVNEGACRKLGYSLEELRGKRILDLHPEDSRREAEKIMGEMFRSERFTCPLDVVTRGGERIPVETRVWFGKWDNRPCVFGISKDLSAEQAALQKFERMFRSNPACMAISRTDDGVILDVNDAFSETLGYSRGEVVGKTGSSINLFVDDAKWLKARERMAADGHLRNFELTLRSKNGRLIRCLFSSDTIRSQGQEFFLTVMVDITRQVELQMQIEAEQKRLVNIIEGTRLGTWEWSVQTDETLVNERWASMIGYTIEELEPITIDTWKRFLHPEDLAESMREIDLHFRGKTPFYERENRLRHKNGSWVWVLDRGAVIEWDEQGRPLKMYGTHTDITEKKKLEERIRDLAIRDPLTDAFNRRYLYERLGTIVSEFVRSGKGFCLSMFDIDHFKRINDEYGHQAGDFILREFVRLIGSRTRPYDLGGRYGGEEFVIVSPGMGRRENAVMVRRIMDAVRGTTFRFEDQEIVFTFSCGFVDSLEFSPSAITSEAMIGLADRRLYQAKEEGRDRCVGT